MNITLSSGFNTVIDNEDITLIEKYNWYYDHGYARTSIDGKKVYLHRLLTNAPAGLHVDHKNGDKLDNRRSNIRVCMEKENQRNVPMRSHNTSGFKGVRWSFGKWSAYITVDKKQIYLGRFIDKLDAAKAYDIAAIKYHGEFARTNI